MGPISYLSTETRDNADLAQITPTKPERRIRSNVILFGDYYFVVIMYLFVIVVLLYSDLK